MAHHPAGSPAPTQPGSLSRRTVLRGSLLGAGAVTAPALLAACSSKKSGSSGSSNKPTTFGSNHSDPTDKQAMTAAINAYTTKTGKPVTINTVDHGTFQENINRYLQGTPEDAFSWFAGYRMQFFAAKGLATDISDVWKDSAFSDFSPALKAASTGQDGKQYFVPFYYYQWAVFYRKSLWQQHGYTAPKTWDEYKALAAKMKSDGLVPISLGDKDGWPAMGTFDYINMRQNGYQFHVDLMAGKEDWTSDKVKKVFDTWAGILPYCQDGANGRTWQEAANALVQKQAGMHVLGMFVGQQFQASELDDLDFFPFPEIDAANAQDSVEAPIDGFMLSKKAKNPEGAKELMKFLGTPEAESAFLKVFPSNLACSSKYDTAGYNTLQKKAVDLISNAKHISQFMDRDTRPDFASTVMIPSIQQFLANPKDIDNLTKNIEAQKKTIFASD